MAKKSTSQPKPQPQSAITGQYVTKPYAAAHPNTTFTEKPKSKR